MPPTWAGTRLPAVAGHPCSHSNQANDNILTHDIERS